MTTKLYKAYKAGTYKPYNRYHIETYKPVVVPGHKYSNRFGWSKEKYSTLLPVNDMEAVSVVFNGPYITYSINCKSCYVDRVKRKVYSELLPPFTVTVHYRNIKSFH